MRARRHDRSVVSAVLIVKDEEDVLGACLESVAWADEVVVYDTGSTDRTREIARTFTPNVVEGFWDGDFAAARNRALAHATGTWVLSIDADEVLDADEQHLRARLGDRGATLHTVVQVNGRATSRGPAPEVVTARAFLRSSFRWEGALHEQLVPVDPGSRFVVRPLPGVRLRHSGYVASRMQHRDKADRNIAAAHRQIDQLGSGAPPQLLAIARANLARSWIVAGRYAEARDLGRELLSSGDVPELTRVALARALAYAAHAEGDAAEADLWLDVWQSSPGNAAWVWAARAHMAAGRDDPASALSAIEHLPTVTVNGDQQRLARLDLAQLEIWALARLGRSGSAVAVARAAFRDGRQPASPTGLLAALGVAGVDAILPDVHESDWLQLALQCGAEGSREARIVLERMHEARPDRPAPMAVAARLYRVMALEESAEWAARLRQAGLAAQCPLIALGQDGAVDPGTRALAAALATSAYGDPRGLAALKDALLHVPADQEESLVAQLQIVAPGLVAPAA